MGKCSSKAISKDLAEFNNAINQLDIIDLHTLLHPTAAEYTFSQAHTEPSMSRPHSGGIKHTLRNVKVWKSHNVCSQTTLELTERELENPKIHGD